ARAGPSWYFGRMATRRARASVFTEKEFYLDEFRGRTLLVAVHHDDAPDRLRVVGEVARDLLLNDTRVVVLLGGAAAEGRGGLRALERGLAAPHDPTLVPSTPFTPPVLVGGDGVAPVLTLASDDVDDESISET